MLQHYEVSYFCFLALLILTLRNAEKVSAQSSIGRQDYGATAGSSSGNNNGENDEGGGGGEIMAPRAASISSHEPSCEELRAMWRFSKRQSRAAEITNEIPTYRDPFAYNVWDLYYPTTRSLGGLRVNSRYKDASRPVYGKLLIREPVPRFRNTGERLRGDGFDDVPRIYTADAPNSQQLQARRRLSKFRFSGSTNLGNSNNVLTPQRGSFQRLKELVWNERAKELAQQRRSEEIAARAAVLKEITNGQGYSVTSYERQQQLSPTYPQDEDTFKTFKAKSLSELEDDQPFSDLLSRSNTNYNNNKMAGEQFLVDEPINYSKYNENLLTMGSNSNSPLVGHQQQQQQQQSPQHQPRSSGSYLPRNQSHFRERNRAAASLRNGNY